MYVPGIMVQAFLHRPNLVPYGHRIPMAPLYFLKLKSADGLREVCAPLSHASPPSLPASSSVDRASG